VSIIGAVWDRVSVTDRLRRANEQKKNATTVLVIVKRGAALFACHIRFWTVIALMTRWGTYSTIATVAKGMFDTSSETQLAKTHKGDWLHPLIQNYY
jgi:stalled ribosome rescue protein Dom34